MVITSSATPSCQAIWERLASVPDPEIPVISIVDLGIVRGVEMSDLGVCTLTLTPTYSGCPATDVIAQDVRKALSIMGCTSTVIKMRLSPPWTTNWMTEEGKKKLRDYGIAPPHVTTANEHAVDISRIRPLGLHLSNSLHAAALRHSEQAVSCPRCACVLTEKLSQYGSTPCKAQYRCLACREPFDYFKPH